MIFWVRPPQARELIFGCLLEAEDLREFWQTAVSKDDRPSRQDVGRPEFILALLDDKGRPVATQPPAVAARDWKHPFVASEVGEALPHWEAALYLVRPEQLKDSARGVRRTLYLLIGAALAAIACGGWIVQADIRRQLALAQKKTDFVSNVSHELKTPLTSIRMFAELMQGSRVEPSKREQYVRIIMVEAERLTRLINNVLDFARLDRGEKRTEKRPIDLHAVMERVWEMHELHLQDSGFQTSWEAAPPPYPVIGDADALAQVLVNLLSNAEKYSTHRKEITLRSSLDGNVICVSVLDRGSGVPAGEEARIFQAFHRGHDSLSSGIQGTGLGLTLAQQLVREHGGEIIYRSRPGGGSDFTVRLPLARSSE
jgi:signal transduction histidine kinase